MFKKLLWRDKWHSLHLKGNMALCTSIFPLLPSLLVSALLLKNQIHSFQSPFSLDFSVLIICRLIFPAPPAKILPILLAWRISFLIDFHKTWFALSQRHLKYTHTNSHTHLLVWVLPGWRTLLKNEATLQNPFFWWWEWVGRWWICCFYPASSCRKFQSLEINNIMLLSVLAEKVSQKRENCKQPNTKRTWA